MSDLEKVQSKMIPRVATLHYDPDTGAPTAAGRARKHSRRLSENQLELRRTNSIGRTTVDPSNRLPTEFRTLSIHVTETQGKDVAVAKKSSVVRELADLDWHKLSVEEVAQRLGVAISAGLDSPMVQRRTQQNGPNTISPPPRRTFRKILGYIFGGFGSLLLVASIICFISWKPLGEPNPAPANLALAVVLLIVILIQAIFNAWQDWSTSRVMASISGMLPAETLVQRDGSRKAVPASQLVTGDVIYIQLGNKLPADVRFIETSGDLKFDRAVLTGESEAITATLDCTDDNFLESKNVGLQGTHCTSGNGMAIVIQTGDNTVFGRIAKLSSASTGSLTTLQREILRFVLIIGALALFTAIIVIILWGAWLRVDYPNYLSVPGMLVDVISVLVAFIPEGLPVCVTLSLTVIARAMRRSSILCKSLTTVESLGSINVLCSDKTGTLTKNQMTVYNACVGDFEFTTQEGRDSLIRNDDKASLVRQLQFVAGVCNGATFDDPTSDKPITERLIAGDATDSAILRFAETIHSVSQTEANLKTLFKIPFNSKNKWMLKMIQPQEAASAEFLSSAEKLEDGDTVMLVKGAPEILLRRCKNLLTAENTLVDLTPEVQAALTARQESWAKRGQRVLLLARRIVPLGSISKELANGSPAYVDRVVELNDGLTVVGMVGIVDPPKDDIPEVVRICRGAGIRFFVVTGDFQLTAAAIAKQVGIITKEIDELDTIANLDSKMAKDTVVPYNGRDGSRTVKSIVLSGSDLITLNESQWEQLVNYEEIVFARTTPEQKLRIVREFQARENIVGMTGDGVNDAPSLKAADVGIAMGNGSDVAMEAADMVLLDSFSSIIVAIEYGRLVFDNLKKVILYLLPAGSFSELWPVVVNILLGLPQPLSSIEMIIICVLTDVGPALSLILEKPEADLLTRPPRHPKKDRLADAKLLMHAYFFLGVTETVCSMAMAFWHLSRLGYPFSEIIIGFNFTYTPEFLAAVSEAQSVYFINLVIMQWFNLLATRTRRLSIFQQNPLGNKTTRNLVLFPAMLLALIIAIFFLYVPFFNSAFGTAPIPWYHYFLPMAFGLVMLGLDEARKWNVRNYPKGFLARIAW